MDQKKYPAFTLIEMLIVMGILSVLMAIGVAVARFAIQRANSIQHQSAVDQMFQAFQSYYTDNRAYPSIGTGGLANKEISGFAEALSGGVIDQYVDANFDGGSPARFYYFTTSSNYPQSFLVCVSFDEPQGIADNIQGGYCNGNGFGDSSMVGVADQVTTKDIPAGSTATDFSQLIDGNRGSGACSEWDGTAFSDGC